MRSAGPKVCYRLGIVEQGSPQDYAERLETEQSEAGESGRDETGSVTAGTTPFTALSLCARARPRRTHRSTPGSSRDSHHQHTVLFIENRPYRGSACRNQLLLPGAMCEL